VVDAKENRIHHGDSLGSPIPSDLLETYQWWIAQHSSTSFELQDLPIARQEDGSMCGVLADNCLNHFVFPNVVPLYKGSEMHVARMATFCHVGDHILEHVNHTMDSGPSASLLIQGLK
jgi:hypothetical protein